MFVSMSPSSPALVSQSSPSSSPPGPPGATPTSGWSGEAYSFSSPVFDFVSD